MDCPIILVPVYTILCNFCFQGKILHPWDFHVAIRRRTFIILFNWSSTNMKCEYLCLFSVFSFVCIGLSHLWSKLCMPSLFWITSAWEMGLTCMKLYISTFADCLKRILMFVSYQQWWISHLRVRCFMFLQMNQMQSELILARSLIAEKDAEIQRVRSTNNQVCLMLCFPIYSSYSAY